MTVTAATLADLSLAVHEETTIDATVEASFGALLEQLGPSNVTPEGDPLPMTLEAWPGGRWYRDLGNGNGHHWGHVQAIRRPTLLEITGPLFMSCPVASNLQFRLRDADGHTVIRLHHTALGLIPDDHRSGLSAGWKPLLERVKAHAGG